MNYLYPLWAITLSAVYGWTYWFGDRNTMYDPNAEEFEKKYIEYSILVYWWILIPMWVVKYGVKFLRWTFKKGHRRSAQTESLVRADEMLGNMQSFRISLPNLGIVFGVLIAALGLFAVFYNHDGNREMPVTPVALSEHYEEGSKDNGDNNNNEVSGNSETPVYIPETPVYISETPVNTSETLTDGGPDPKDVELYTSCYQRWEEMAKEYYNAIKFLNDGLTDSNGDLHALTPGLGIESTTYHFHNAQREMRNNRFEAARHNVTIPQSYWETVEIHR